MVAAERIALVRGTERYELIQSNPSYYCISGEES
jgi:hypothetical protein